MISWEPIKMKENIVSNTLGWGEFNQLLMLLILMPRIGVLMNMSREMARSLLTDGVVGWDFNAKVVYLREYKEGFLVHHFDIPWYSALDPQ
jgi:hypothetical protein